MIEFVDCETGEVVECLDGGASSLLLVVEGHQKYMGANMAGSLELLLQLLPRGKLDGWFYWNSPSEYELVALAECMNVCRAKNLLWPPAWWSASLFWKIVDGSITEMSGDDGVVSEKYNIINTWMAEVFGVEGDRRWEIFRHLRSVGWPQSSQPKFRAAVLCASKDLQELVNKARRKGVRKMWAPCLVRVEWCFPVLAALVENAIFEDWSLDDIRNLKRLQEIAEMYELEKMQEDWIRWQQVHTHCNYYSPVASGTGKFFTEIRFGSGVPVNIVSGLLLKSVERAQHTFLTQQPASENLSVSKKIKDIEKLKEMQAAEELKETQRRAEELSDRRTFGRLRIELSDRRKCKIEHLLYAKNTGIGESPRLMKQVVRAQEELLPQMRVAEGTG